MIATPHQFLLSDMCINSVHKCMHVNNTSKSTVDKLIMNPASSEKGRGGGGGRGGGRGRG